MFIETENKNLLRDTNSRAIIINDEKTKRKFLEQRDLEKKINKLESEITDIKNIMQQILLKLDK